MHVHNSVKFLTLFAVDFELLRLSHPQTSCFFFFFVETTNKKIDHPFSVFNIARVYKVHRIECSCSVFEGVLYYYNLTMTHKIYYIIIL